MDLQVTHLRTLQAIARHGSFSARPRSLNLTQPAVSMQVRHLERALGLPLLERVGKRAFPPAPASCCWPTPIRALRELEAGVERVQQLRGVVAGACAWARARPSASTCCRRRCGASARAIRRRRS
jgi:DNA-binding transcriptional LysR family regulator